MKLGIHEIVPESEINRNGIILHSHCVVNIKNHGEGSEYFRARLVIFEYVDPEKPRVVDEALTVTENSVRTTLTAVSSFNFELFARDISLDFLQSKDKLKRDVCARTPKGSNILENFGAPAGSILKSIKPQYFLAESPSYWWQTFRDWHVNDLGMLSTNLDPCFFFKKHSSVLQGIQVVQVDDTCGNGTAEFAALEANKSKQFSCKPREKSFH